MVVAPRSAIIRSFGALIPLQPVAWTDDGLLCAPQLAPEPVWDCPLPLVPAPCPPVVADSPARLVAGWYRRSDVHAPAPPGFPELVQAPGDGFGPADHPTTTMCLAALRDLPNGTAIDAGCGSGLLTLAWWTARRGSVTGIDADPRAVAHARRSADLMGLDGAYLFDARRIETLGTDEVGGRVVLANLPPVAHEVLARRVTIPPRAVLLSGFTRRDRDRVLAPYRALGMRRIRSRRLGRYECHVLVGDA